MYLHVRSLKCDSCGSCKCFRSEATLFGCLKDSKDSNIQPGQKLLKGLVESQAISTGGYRGQILGFLARKLHQTAMQEELGKLIPKVQANLTTHEGCTKLAVIKI